MSPSAAVPISEPSGLFRPPFADLWARTGLPESLAQTSGQLTPDVSDAELVAALIHDGEPLRETLARAHRVLELSGGLYGLTRATTSHLREAGLPVDVALKLQSALLLGRRASSESPPRRALNASVVGAMYQTLLAHLSHEELHLVLLDRKNRYIGRRRLASGGTASVTVHVRDVLGPVLEARGHAFVLVHNHPSGNAEPSPEDRRLSAQVAAAADLVGLTLVDHLVVSTESFESAMAGPARWGKEGAP